MNFRKCILGIVIFLFLFLILSQGVSAYGDCSEYGTFAYSTWDDYCECMSGYVFGKNMFGETVCVSGDSLCEDEYGYHANYDSFSGNCECSYGYRFGLDSIGRTQCISDDDYCENKLGYNSRYNSLSDSCECESGYEMSLSDYGSGFTCLRCSTKYGMYSSYNYLSKSCECDDGYTLVEGECVEKSNSAYFKLQELDTNNQEAIIESNYNGVCYKISYGTGCYSFSLKTYLGKDIIINMGTDFYVDKYDYLVLPDHEEICELKEVEVIDCGYTLKEIESSTLEDYVLRQELTALACGDHAFLKTDNTCGCDIGYEWIVNNGVGSCQKIILEIENNNVIDSELTEKLKGKILLQVEDLGQAWYINPVNGIRYYMKDGTAAYQIMRDLGVGITNNDLNAIMNNVNFAKQHKGKIFLQVEDLGQAYYIDFEGQAHYLKDGAAAYQIMRDLGLGITNSDLSKIQSN